MLLCLEYQGQVALMRWGIYLLAVLLSGPSHQRPRTSTDKAS